MKQAHVPQYLLHVLNFFSNEMNRKFCRAHLIVINEMLIRVAQNHLSPAIIMNNSQNVSNTIICIVCFTFLGLVVPVVTVLFQHYYLIRKSFLISDWLKYETDLRRKKILQRVERRCLMHTNHVYRKCVPWLWVKTMSASLFAELKRASRGPYVCILYAPKRILYTADIVQMQFRIRCRLWT